MWHVALIKFHNGFFLAWIHKWLIDRPIFHRTQPGKQGALIFNSFNNTVALPECHGQWPWDQEFKFYADSSTLSFVFYCPEFLGYTGIIKWKKFLSNYYLLKMHFFWKMSIYFLTKNWYYLLNNYKLYCYSFENWFS